MHSWGHVNVLIVNAVKRAVQRDFLVARDEVSNITDMESLKSNFPDIWAALHQNAAQTKVNLEWGKEKEAFGMCAARAIPSRLPGVDVAESDELRETGFTSCTAHRFDSLLLQIAGVHVVSKCNGAISSWCVVY